MKFTILAFGAAAASIFCVNNYSHAQISLRSPLPQQTIRLVSQDDNDAFGLFNSPEAKEATPDETTSDNSSILTEAQPIAELTEDPSGQIPDPAATAPNSARPGKLTEQFTEKAPLAVLAHTPQVGMVPVYWPQGMAGCATPNPIAAIMARNWCTQGLWDSYQCERDLQCQCIQQQLNGSGHCGHCGSAGHCGHGHGNHHHAVNRYAVPMGTGARCGTFGCASGSCASSGIGSVGLGCDGAAPSQAQWAPSGPIQPGQMIHAPAAPAGNSNGTIAPAPAPANAPASPATAAPTPLVNGSPAYRSVLMPSDLPTVPARLNDRPIFQMPIQSAAPSVAGLPQVPSR